MTITFRVEDGRSITPPSAAVITPDQLAAFRDMLAEQALRLGFTLLLSGDASLPIRGWQIVLKRSPKWRH